ncbi:hypothetical protein H2198_010275 [Neophaeococcomyces mojaviensis]|uniref:Uncharacterized protein n=1 Tax=Neophaeococcomyces mojaviensis TaxID=3383035 RepID=A0ACC2ZS42_9EURO|nr:hypothetical protein H2198_010275 [Knufia sp. JES_112]
MDLFRQRSTRITLPSPISESSSLSSPLDSPVDLCSPDSAVDRDPRRFATLFNRWANRSPSVVVQAEAKAKHVLVEAPGYPVLTLPVHDWQWGSSPVKSTLSPRLPRHVPIIIPDFASPYGPPLPKTPVLNDPSRLIPPPSDSQPADAPKLDTESPKSREKETLQNDTKTTMNISQISLSASESGADSAASSIHQSHSHTNLVNASVSPTTQQNSTAGNVSGLVCNVYRTTGQEPHPLVGATTTILGDKLYVFGGRLHSKTRPTLSSDLYELDLIRRHWTKLDTTGDIPAPRYFHSVCALGDSKLVCYGGMSPAPHLRSLTNGVPSPKSSDALSEVVVMGDIHVYDVTTNKWTEIHPLRSDNPEGRYAHCATILPSSAVFTSADSHTSAIHHNPSSTDPHSGQLGVQIDGTGGAELVIVGGQDGANSYIEQISVFNLRSLKWTSSTPYDRKCGAYKSMVTSLPGINGQCISRGGALDEGIQHQVGTPMLIYSNYNFLDIRLELQIRMPDGSIEEKSMSGQVSPPGLRFPNGGVINGHFVVSGTYLTSSKHEYALWALDLRTLTWAMIDTAGTVFGQGSWNRGVLWSRRNTYVILGHRKRNLVDDYNHRRINFAHVCLVELEAYGLYDNPRRKNPSSAYISNSAPAIPLSLQQDLPSRTAGGRSISAIAEQLGYTALYVNEMCDMDIVAQGGERIPCNSSILSHRWGPYFNQLMLDSSTTDGDNTMSEAATLRPTMGSRASRISALTITPSTNGISSPSASLINGPELQRTQSRSTARTLVDLPNSSTIPAASRGRALYMPHMAQTIKLMLHYLYTSSLPPLNNPLCSPHTLCSLLQMARPYQVDGLQEATIERLHEALDGRNAAAVFNAAAMAAGGGRATGMGAIGTLEALERRESAATAVVEDTHTTSVSGNEFGARRGHRKTNSGDSTSTAATSTTFSQTDTDSPLTEQDASGGGRRAWNGEMSSVIGLQKRGLRGLMEGRRLRERANTAE